MRSDQNLIYVVMLNHYEKDWTCHVGLSGEQARLNSDHRLSRFGAWSGRYWVFIDGDHHGWTDWADRYRGWQLERVSEGTHTGCQISFPGFSGTVKRGDQVRPRYVWRHFRGGEATGSSSDMMNAPDRMAMLDEMIRAVYTAWDARINKKRTKWRP